MTPIITKKSLRESQSSSPAPRSFNVAPTGTTPPPPPPDDPLDRVRKLVPAEVIAGYTALLAIAAQIVGDSACYAMPTAVVACMALIVLALRRAGRTHTPPTPPPVLQYVFATLAFVAWAFSIHDPLAPFGLHIPSWISAFGCVLIPLFGSYLIDLTDQEPAT